ncbi:Lipoprotein PrgK [Bienertia sinuspersici]
METFEGTGDREKVMDQGPWSFDGKLLLLKDVKRGEQPAEMSFNMARFWVKVYQVPEVPESLYPYGSWLRASPTRNKFRSDSVRDSEMRLLEEFKSSVTNLKARQKLTFDNVGEGGDGGVVNRGIRVGFSSSENAQGCKARCNTRGRNEDTGVKSVKNGEGTYVDSRGRSGGLGLLWKMGVEVWISSKSLHHIDCFVKGLFGDTMWRFTGFYGWPENAEKYLSWELLRELKASNNWDGPWLCAGDFNQILYNEEKLGGSLREQSVMREFKEALEDCGLMDLGYVKFEYTWWNGREGEENIHERLDRMVGNNKWLEEFPLLTVYHLNQGDSDHFPLKLVEYKGNKNMRRKGYSFKFEDYWLTSDQCGEVVKEAWGKGKEGGELLVPKRLWEVSEALKKWNANQREKGEINFSC